MNFEEQELQAYREEVAEMLANEDDGNSSDPFEEEVMYD